MTKALQIVRKYEKHQLYIETAICDLFYQSVVKHSDEFADSFKEVIGYLE